MDARDKRGRKLSKTEEIHRKREEQDRKLHQEEAYRRKFYEGAQTKESFYKLLRKISRPVVDEPSDEGNSETSE